MTVPLWVLLAFAVWTIAVLMTGIGIRRWALILSGRAQMTDFPADVPHGSTAYRRAVRAHANCVENLPVYGAVALCTFAAQATSPLLDTLALAFIAARICQSLIHMLFPETNLTVLVRFTFFLTQLVAMLWMAWETVRHASL
ncbi:MAG: MAPEG family protein [Micropepsaceae bacterium]